MRRLFLVPIVVLSVFALGTSLSADIRSDQRVKFQLGGALGKLVNVFAGKAAREGVTTMVAVRGDRKISMSDSTGQIVDLAEEKVYDLDIKKKSYTVTTFAEVRKRMEEARREMEKARREAPAEPSKPAEKDPNAKEFEVDVDVKKTAETRQINGFNTTKTIVLVTVREKGKTLNESGGLVITSDMWLAANAPSTKELMEFEQRYAQKLAGPVIVGASAQEMASVMAIYPQLKPALDRMRAEGNKITGTAILSDMRMEGVPPGTADQPSAAAPAPPAEEPKKRGGLGGMLGGLKKMAEAADKGNQGNSKPERAIIMTTSVEMLKLTTDVDAASVAIPAGFTEKK